MQQNIHDIVVPGETVLWSGTGPAGIRFRNADIVLIPFSLFWAGFVIAWESAVFRAQGSWLSGLWGLPFVAVGLYLIAGRFVVDAYFRARTRYIVTNRAAYIARGGIMAATRRYAGSALDSLDYEAGANGTGTIRFVPEASIFARNAGWGAWNGAPLDAFYSIPGAKAVYEMLASTAAKP
jgi:hypothetical protein